MGAGTTVSILPCGAMTADLTWLLLAPGRAIRNRQNKHLPAEWVDVPTHCVLVDTPDGKLLWDTSCPRDWEQRWDPTGLQDFFPYEKVSDDEYLDSRLKQLGLAPGDIDYVVLSHLHFDHAGNLQLFKETNARPRRRTAARSRWPPAAWCSGQRTCAPAGPARLGVMSRPDGRSVTELRPVKLTRGWLDHAEGSVLVEFGRTRVLCAASVTEDVPRWRRGSGLGWVTAEYAMLPRATNSRNDRESVKGRLGGRTHEISRLVGRSLRASVDYKALGENTIVIDCDVLQADGGTRTAAVTGGYVALAEAVAWLKGRKRTKGDPLLTSVSAVSVGIVDGEPRLDLCYEEDVVAQTDMNVVCTAAGDFVEIQGTAEQEPFSRELLGQLLDLAVAGCGELTRLQHEALS